MSRKFFSFFLPLFFTLAIGGLSSLLVGERFAIYDSVVPPPFAPPAGVFPVVWTILYLLIGTAAGLVQLAGGEARENALLLYWCQLTANFIWPTLFFTMEAFFAAFLWILLLDLLIVLTTVHFGRIRAAFAMLMLPYLFWVLFATYLSFGIWVLND
ncbi:MAG TPA: tryptophan-rich sensory protein [Oscillospiraceae bacterium]|nr:tryptophan-rich sensory protein [Oscillospiraceae bacterium]HNW04870.1 tryptophan-rich sensory protein [Oscillospiraceae bacterium]HPW00535.1 tryptophan-rich sensory protein [Oscillospiraceae bacterium]